MIKEINILENSIEIKEEKKGLFGIKEHILEIDIESISKIERIIKNKELIGFAIWRGREVMYAIGIKNYKGDLEELYSRILGSIKENLVEIVETEL